MIQLVIPSNADLQLLLAYAFVPLFVLGMMFLFHYLVSKEVFVFTKKRLLISLLVFLIQVFLTFASFQLLLSFFSFVTLLLLLLTSFLYVSIIFAIIEIVKNRLFKSRKSIVVLSSIILLNPYSVLFILVLFIYVVAFFIPLSTCGYAISFTDQDGLSPLQEAGAREGDIIKTVRGVPIDSQETLLEVLSEHSPGETVLVETNGGFLLVTLGEHPLDDSRAFLGARLLPLSCS